MLCQPGCQDIRSKGLICTAGDVPSEVGTPPRVPAPALGVSGQDQGEGRRVDAASSCGVHGSVSDLSLHSGDEALGCHGRVQTREDKV